MAERCALCGDRATERISLKSEWQETLRDERGLEPPINRYEVPLCRECSPRYDYLREMHFDLGMMNEEMAEEHRQEIDELVAEIEVEALIDVEFNIPE